MPSIRSRLINIALGSFFRSRWNSRTTVEDFRSLALRLDKYFGPTADTDIQEISAFGVPCTWVRARDVSSDRCLYYIHGGGFIAHLPQLYVHFAEEMGRRINAQVLLANYRLAPEHPFPAAPDDCLSVYRWLVEEHGIDTGRFLVAGDSAGGNLALVTLLRAKAAGLPMPSAAWLVSPAVDMDWEHQSFDALEQSDPMFTTETMALMDGYMTSHDRRCWRLSPILGDLRGLPALLVEAGGREMLAEHPDRFAERARQFGVEVHTRVWEGMPHAFQLFDVFPEADDARSKAADFLLASTTTK